MSRLRPPLPRRLGARLTLFLLVLLAGLALAVGIVVVSGFRRSEDHTTRLSREGTLEFGANTVASFARFVSEGTTAQIAPYEQTTRTAAAYIVAARAAAAETAPDDVELVRAAGTGWFNPDPARLSDVWLPASRELDDAIRADVRNSAALDLLLPGEIENHESAVAAYFVAVSGLTRYYPPVGLESRLAPDFDSAAQSSGGSAGPAANPSRLPVWSAPYNDPAGRGLLVTVTTPVYAERGEFVGIVGVDVSLSRFVASIDDVRPSPGGFAFALGSDGAMFPSRSSAAVDAALADPGNLAIGRVLAAMRARQAGTERVTIDGVDVVIGYAPLDRLGGSIGLVVPVDDISDEADIAAVTGAIADDGRRTLIFVGLIVGALFLVALAVASYMSRRYLTYPIGALASGTRAVAAGDLSVAIPVHRRDELGELAAAFNDMTSTLSVRAAQLRDETAERTRAQQELEAVVAAMADTVMVLDRAGRFVRVPALHAGRLPVAADDVRGRDLADLFPAEAAASLASALRLAIDGRNTVTTEYRLPDVDLWFSAAVSPLDGDTAVIVTRDITERVRASQLLEQRVEERTRELAAVVEASRNVTARLELDPLLTMLLSQLRALLPHDGSTLSVLDGEELVFLESRGHGGRQDAVIGRRIPTALLGSIWTRCERGEYVLISDLQDDSPDAQTLRNLTAVALPERHNFVRSSMIVPLRARDHVIGALTVSRIEPGSLTPADAGLVSAFSNFAAIAIDNARLFEEARKRVRQNTALARVGANLRHALSLGDVLDRTAADVRDAAGAVAVSIIIGDPEPPHFSYAGSAGLPDGYLDAMVDCWREGAYLVGPTALLGGEPVVVPGAHQRMAADPAFTALWPHLGRFSFDAVVSLPVRIGQEILGALNVYLPAGAPASSDDLGFLAAMADQVSIVVTNAYLVQQSDERARDLEIVLTAADRLSTTLDFDRLVDVAFDQLDLVAPHDGEAIYLLDGNAVRAFHRRGADRSVPPRVFRLPASSSGPLTMRVFSGEVVALDDVQGGDLSGAWTANARALGIADDGSFVRSVLGVPLVVSGRVIGAIAMVAEQPAQFTARHRRLAQGVAYQMAVAFENASLFAETRARANEMAALYQADEALYRSLDIGQVFQALVDVLVEVLEADRSAVIGRDPGGALTAIASRGYAPETIDRLMAPGAVPGIADAFANAEPVTVDDASMLPLQGRALSDEGVQAFANLPVVVGDEVIVLLHFAYTQPHRFTGDETRIGLALSRRAAVAIQNARLYEQAQQAASLEERQRIARDLHDSVSQALYGIALGARTARTLLDRDSSLVEQPLDYILSLSEAGLAELRALIFELRPDALSTDGLVAALDRQAAATRARHRVTVETDFVPEPDVPIAAKEALYRIAQEAMSNAIKHARATSLAVRLWMEDGALRLAVRDDGVGFDTGDAFPGHMGLKSMRERAQRLGGDATVTSAPGRGTTVSASLPLDRD